MKRIFLYLIVSLFLLSCSDKGSRVSEISVNEYISMESVKPLGDIVDSVRYVSLKDDTANIFFSGAINKIMTKGDTMYILDAHESKTLRAYKKDGEFLFNVGTRGRGRGEYIDMVAFTIDNQYIYGVNNATKKLLVYNIDNGKYLKQLDLPRWVGDIALFKDGKFMLYEEPNDDEDPSKVPPEERFKIFITDQNLKIIDKLFPHCEDDCRALSTGNAFTENKDKIVFSQMAKDTIVAFDKNSYLDQDYYVVDLGDDKASVVDKQDYDKLMEVKHLQPPVYIVDSTIIGDIHGLGKSWFLGTFVYSMNNKQVYQNANAMDMYKGKAPSDKLVLEFKGVVDNEILSVISYAEYRELVKSGFPIAPKHLEKQLKDDELLLIFYSLKGV